MFLPFKFLLSGRNGTSILKRGECARDAGERLSHCASLLPAGGVPPRDARPLCPRELHLCGRPCPALRRWRGGAAAITAAEGAGTRARAMGSSWAGASDSYSEGRGARRGSERLAGRRTRVRPGRLRVGCPRVFGSLQQPTPQPDGDVLPRPGCRA